MSRPTHCIIFAAALLLFPTTAVGQEDRGTPEQRAACAPDAFRLCFGDIPDAVRVEACLRQNQGELGAACRAVFEKSAASNVNPVRTR